MPTANAPPVPTPAGSATTALLVAGMLISGTMNTLLTKYQDMQCVENCDVSASGNMAAERRYFEQPVIQTLNMFVGEILCLVAVELMGLYSRWKSTGEAAAHHDDGAASRLPPLTGWARLQLLPPALCDITGTTLLNLGLLYTSASVFQMLRGGVVLFTGILSVLWLGRRLYGFHWLGLISVTVGVAIVGLASVLSPASKAVVVLEVDADMALAGIFMILTSLIFAATQYVVEERVFSRHSLHPLRAVGYEGVFGFTIVSMAMLVMYLVYGTGHGGFTDIPAGLHDLTYSPRVLAAAIGICFSIAIFNFCGLSVTKRVSSTARATVDASRTLFIWIVSLGLGWEHFRKLQVIGFVLLAYGTFLFNGVVKPPKWLNPEASADGEANDSDEARRLLRREAGEDS